MPRSAFNRVEGQAGREKGEGKKQRCSREAVAIISIGLSTAEQLQSTGTNSRLPSLTGSLMLW